MSRVAIPIPMGIPWESGSLPNTQLKGWDMRVHHAHKWEYAARVIRLILVAGAGESRDRESDAQETDRSLNDCHRYRIVYTLSTFAAQSCSESILTYCAKM